MLALYILLGVVGFLFILLLIPAGVDIFYDEKARVTLRYGPFRKYIRQHKKSKTSKPAAPKSPAKAKTKQPAKAKSNPAGTFLKELYQSEGFSGLMEFLISLIRLLTSSTYIIVKQISVSHLDLLVIVRGEDAAQTATQYGALCGALYPAFGLLCETKPSRDPRISVVADYEKGETQGVLSVSLRILPLFLVGHLLALAWRFLLLVVKVRAGSNQPTAPGKSTLKRSPDRS